MQEGGWRPVMALLTMLWWLLPLHCAASQHSIASSLSLVGPPLPAITHTYQPPYKQLLIAEGSGAVDVVVSPLSPSSSCPALPVPVLVLVLVLVPLAFVLASLASLSPPLPSLPVLAHCHCGDGDRPISTCSTLRARVSSGGRWVLGCGLILVISACLV